MYSEKSLQNSLNLYEDIKIRTNGEIYIGVVGPVRTGKSTFIKRFMEMCVIPNIEDDNVLRRTIDELPQSGTGNTIMTTEPKFIPGDTTAISINGLDAKLRMVDCVGFMVDGALGVYENGVERLVHTPWVAEEIPFSMAAKLGTEKVIEDHSTVGVVVTTDGSFTGIERDNYIVAEEMAVEKLKKIGKPFIIILNTTKPYSAETKEMAEKMNKKYGVKVFLLNLEQLKPEDAMSIIEGLLGEFPVNNIAFELPAWIEILRDEHWLKEKIMEKATEILDTITCIKDSKLCLDIEKGEYIEGIELDKVDMSNGNIKITFKLSNVLYYEILSELTGTRIEDEYELISIIKNLSDKKNVLNSITDAINQVESTGFGIVTPDKSEISLNEPEIIKNGNKYGVKIKAKVPSVNLLKTYIEVEIAPIVGTKSQADDLIEYIKGNAVKDSEGIWNTNIFGKTVEEIVFDGIYEKTHNITSDNMEKISGTIEKVMNDNSGLVCLIV